MDVIDGGLEIVGKQRMLLFGVCLWLSWLFSVLSLTHCNFMDNGRQRLGLFSLPYISEDEENLGCVIYGNDDNVDSGLKAGRAFGVLTTLFATLAACFMTAATVRTVSGHVLFKLGHCCAAVAALSQMLVFTALSSRNCREGCTLVGVGILAICNTILLDTLCLIWFFLSPPDASWIVWNSEQCTERGNGNMQNPSNPEPSGNDSSPGVVTKSEDSVATFDKSTTSDNTAPLFGNIQDLLSFRLTTVLLVLVAWVVSLFYVNRCSLLQVMNPTAQNLNFSGLGLFSQGVYDGDRYLGCVSYSDRTTHEFDSSFRTARAFGVLTTILTTTILLISMAQLVVKKHAKSCWLALRLILPTATCTQLVTLAAFDSNMCHLDGDDNCTVGGTGIVVILNVFLMSSLSALVIIIPSPKCGLFILKVGLDDKVSKVSCPARLVATCHPGERDPTNTDDSIRRCPSTTVHSNNSRQGEIRAKETDTELGVKSIAVTVEYTESGKKTVKAVTFVDGSQTITTTIEEIINDDESATADDRSESYQAE